MIACRVIVRGRVQGVGFRWHAQQKALGLGVRGWVRNSRSGAVEAHLEGDRAAVEAMLKWFSIGPAAARVAGVEEVATDPIHAESFQVSAEPH